MNRAQRRAQKKKLGKKNNLNKDIAMFELLPDECSACLAPYDKKDKNMVTTWSVVVREQEKIVRLYCPTCWNTAKQVISNNRD